MQNLVIGLLQLTRDLLFWGAILAFGLAFGARLIPVVLPDMGRLIIDRSSLLFCWAFCTSVVMCLGAFAVSWWLSMVSNASSEAHSA